MLWHGVTGAGIKMLSHRFSSLCPESPPRKLVQDPSSSRHAEEGSVQSRGHRAGGLGPQGHHHRRERDARPDAPQVTLSTKFRGSLHNIL